MSTPQDEATCCCQRCDKIKSVFDFGDDDDYRYCNVCYEVVQAEHTQREVERIASRAAELGCTIKLVKLIEALEHKIERLQEECESIREDTHTLL